MAFEDVKRFLQFDFDEISEDLLDSSGNLTRFAILRLMKTSLSQEITEDYIRLLFSDKGELSPRFISLAIRKLEKILINLKKFEELSSSNPSMEYLVETSDYDSISRYLEDNKFSKEACDKFNLVCSKLNRIDLLVYFYDKYPEELINYLRNYKE
jgi:prephenate dehydratase